MKVLTYIRTALTDARIRFLLWRYRRELRRPTPSDRLRSSWEKYVAALDARNARIANLIGGGSGE